MEMNNDIFTPDLPIPEPVSFEDAPCAVGVVNLMPRGGFAGIFGFDFVAAFNG